MDLKKCKCPCHKFNGILISLAALTFLLGNIDVLDMNTTHTVWPVFIIIAGLNHSFLQGVCKCC